MDVERVFAALDEELRLDGADQVTLIICGAAVIRLRDGHDIDTNDVDSLTVLAGRVRAAARRVQESAVGISEGLGEDWLNETVIRIGIPTILPAGWEDRAFAQGPLFKGKSGLLLVYGLDRIDMIRSKLLCLFDEWGREIDRDVAQLKRMLKSAEEALDEAGWVHAALSTYEPGRWTRDDVANRLAERLKP
jgi:hypothetical protein